MMPARLPENRRLTADALDAIVIGGSAGSVNALSVLMPALPTEVPTFVVVHVPANRPSSLAEVLGAATGRTTREAEDKERPEPGCIYFAPPGYHLLIETDRCLALSVDETVCFSRPSIDVLFETAASAFGERLLGILLTGASPDGAQGLKCIHEAGGVSVVQDPASAEAPTMPNAAIEACQPDHVLSLWALADFLRDLTPPSRTAAEGGQGGSDADA